MQGCNSNPCIFSRLLFDLAQIAHMRWKLALSQTGPTLLQHGPRRCRAECFPDPTLQASTQGFTRANRGRPCWQALSDFFVRGHNALQPLKAALGIGEAVLADNPIQHGQHLLLFQAGTVAGTIEA